MNPIPHSPPYDQVHLLLRGMYDDYLRGDSAAIDARLTEDVTLFDSAADALVTGLDQLAALRRSRSSTPTESAAAAWTETALTITDLAVRKIGDVIVATWWLRVDGTDPQGAAVVPELSRNTAVLHPRSAGGLRIAHLHEDVRQEARLQ